MTVETHPAAYIWFDTFPCYAVKEGDEAYLPGSEYRVIATDNRLYVLEDTVDGFTSPVNSPLLSISGTHKDGFTVSTEEGTFRVNRAPNCGCGSRIRGYHPFLGIPFEAHFPKG